MPNYIKYKEFELGLVKQSEEERKKHICGGCFFNNEEYSCVRFICINNNIYKDIKSIRKTKIEDILNG